MSAYSVTLAEASSTSDAVPSTDKMSYSLNLFMPIARGLMSDPGSFDSPDNECTTSSLNDQLRLKAANQASLAKQRAEWQEKWKAMTPIERDALNEAFTIKARKIAAQFGRSIPFISRNHR